MKILIQTPEYSIVVISLLSQGERDSYLEDEQPSLYQIRANSSKICRRVVQVQTRICRIEYSVPHA